MLKAKLVMALPDLRLLLQSSEFKHVDKRRVCGSVAEWSKALVLGTSHFDGVGSNPTAAKFFSPKVFCACTFSVI